MEPFHKKTVLVTGATGFLGEYLTQRLTKRYRVLALGRNRERGKKLEEQGAVFCPGDFTRRESCARYFQGVDYVIHAGALSTVWGEWEDFYCTNVLGTELVAALCRENGVKRLVYLSSPSIYTGKEDQYHIREDQAPEQNNLNYYIKSKLMAEAILRKWEKKGLETVILRPRGLIGIGDTSLVPRILAANAKTGIPLFREGRNLVDLTSVENVALACELSLTAEKAPGRAFNITNGEPMEFRNILEQFLRAIGEEPRYRRLPFGLVYALAGGLEWLYRTLRLAGEPPLTRYTVCTLGYAQTMDISLAREILGYVPEKTLAESIREYGAWWKANHGTGSVKGEEKSSQKRTRTYPASSDCGAEAGRKHGKINRLSEFQKAESGIVAGRHLEKWGNRSKGVPESRVICDLEIPRGYITETEGRPGAHDSTQPGRRAEAGRRPGAHNPTQPDQPHLPAPPGKVEEVKIYPCGSCTNRLGIMFRGMRWEKREFPARAALIRHRELGDILYDTGYSEEIFRGGPGLWLYRLLNPVRLGKEEGICERLKKDGIPPENVKTILLSHAHPDHIGGLSRFPGCRLVAFGETLEALERPRVRNLVFRNLLPPKGCIEKRNTPGNPLENHFLNRYFGQAYDLFGDGSAIAVRLEGHTRGQMGLWIPDVSLFLAADACWGSDLVKATRRMRLLPRLLQKDFAAYEDSLKRICRMKRDYPQIRVVFSHQKGE
nr:NAD-dependent epimerase/dehydratase family protein [uncultured Acetatifactor sp.]